MRPAILALGAVVLLGGCASETASTPPDSPTASEVTVVASRTATGGLCVTGSTCEAVFTVSSDGTWTLTSNANQISGTLAPETVAELVAATTSTRIASSPPFTGTCPIAYDGSELVYSWTDTDGTSQTVSACDKEIAADDPLVVALEQAQQEALADGSAASTAPDDMEAQAARTLAIAETVVGLPEDEAIARIEGVSSVRLTTRVVSRDGETFAVTEDYSPTRVNLTIEAGIVTAVSVG